MGNESSSYSSYPFPCIKLPGKLAIRLITIHYPEELSGKLVIHLVTVHHPEDLENW
jgi:hypothetical protein